MQDVDLKSWTHPNVILVATDLSDLDRLMPFAIDEAHRTGARLILLHAIAATEALTADISGMPYYDPASVLDEASRILDTCCESARDQNVVCDGIVREGNPAQQVLAASKQFHADRIVLGTRSRSKLSKLLLGSVAEQVLRSVNLPVMTVGPEAHLPAESDAPERIVLHATTFREASRPSAALACQMALHLDAKLVLMHVLPHMESTGRKGQLTGLDSAALKDLHTLAEETGADSPVCVETRVIHGNPAIEILAEAVQRKVRLIVMGSTTHSSLQNLTRDRTVYKVLAHAPCPVMTLREIPVKEGDGAIPRMAMHTYSIF